MTKQRGRGDKATLRDGDKGPAPSVSPSSRLRVPLVTLLTDFDTKDYYVAAVKGVILTLNPRARIVDITHGIPPQDIEAAAFILLAVWSSFPVGTIYVAVVDPGVGSSRRPILVRTRDRFFVGPDNGIFSYVCDSSAAAGMTPEIFHLTNTKYFRHPVSATFHGRDVFAPVAAALSKGVRPVGMGTRVTDFVHLPPLQPETSRDGTIRARIIHIDHFGNCVTNITPADLTAQMIAAGAKLRVKGRLVKSCRNYFAEQTGRRGELFGVWGSAGFLEIAASNDSAARILKTQRGDAVVVKG